MLLFTSLPQTHANSASKILHTHTHSIQISNILKKIGNFIFKMEYYESICSRKFQNECKCKGFQLLNKSQTINICRHGDQVS